jgi:hypothetical protein
MVKQDKKLKQQKRNFRLLPVPCRRRKHAPRLCSLRKDVDTMRTLIGFLLALITPALPLLFDRRGDTQWLLVSILLIGFFISPLAIMGYKSLINQDVVSFSAYLKRGILIAAIPVLFFLTFNIFFGGDLKKTALWISLAFFYMFAYSIMTTTFFWFFVVKKNTLQAIFVCLALSITFWAGISFLTTE